MDKNPFIDIVESANKMNNLTRTLKFLRDNYVMVGIPQKKTSRKGEPITNAELLYIHTHGSPINNIPARPVVEPALADDRDRLSKMLKKSALLSLEGKEEEAIEQLKLTGMRGQNVARAWFNNPNNNWPPNSPSVEAAKRKKGSTDPKPLIDTGELRKSITYVLVKKRRRAE